jgi:hypothetical protein
MFNPDTLAKLSSVPFPVFRTSNQAPQRRAWRDFVKEKATKQHVLETSVNELNDIVEAQVNIRQLMTTVKENAGGRPPKVTIEDVVWKKMVDTIGAMEVPDGSKVALLVPPKDLRWGGTGDVRFKQLHALRRGFLAAKFPKLEFIGSPTFYDPVRPPRLPHEPFLSIASVLDLYPCGSSVPDALSRCGCMLPTASQRPLVTRTWNRTRWHRSRRLARATCMTGGHALFFAFT